MMMIRFCVLFLGCAPLVAQEGGIEVFAAEPIFESGWRVSWTELYKPRRDLFRGSHEVADPLGRKSLEVRSIAGIDYGLDRDFQLSLLVPHVYREFEGGGRTLRSSGLADIAFLTKYRFFHREGRARTLNLALVTGLEMPTGETREQDEGQRLAPGLQPGTGAWNPFLATTVTAGRDRFRFDGTLFAKFNTPGAQGYENGNFYSARVAFGYRFLHVKYPGPTVGISVGAEWRHESRAESYNAPVGNSGADELMLLPKIVAHPVPELDLSIGARVPLYQHYHGTQLGRDIEFAIAFGWRF